MSLRLHELKHDGRASSHYARKDERCHLEPIRRTQSKHVRDFLGVLFSKQHDRRPGSWAGALIVK